MHPLKQLRQILNISSQNYGRVVQQQGQSVLIATEKGSKVLKLNAFDKTSYQPEDIVLLNNNTILGKRANNSITYVV